MAIIHVNEIRKMGKEERSKKVTELKTELSRLMTTKAMGGSLENPSRIRLIRKAIAQFNTILREEELGIKREPAEKQAKAKEKEAKAPKEEVEKEKPKKEKKATKKAPKKVKEPKAEEEEEEDD
jgi:large subunit ribosomal protein L29